MIFRTAASSAAYAADFSESGRTATDVIMALTCGDVFLWIWTDILKSVFEFGACRLEGTSGSDQYLTDVVGNVI
jgi:hypothetical protein